MTTTEKGPSQSLRKRIDLLSRRYSTIESQNHSGKFFDYSGMLMFEHWEVSTSCNSIRDTQEVLGTVKGRRNRLKLKAELYCVIWFQIGKRCTVELFKHLILSRILGS